MDKVTGQESCLVCTTDQGPTQFASYVLAAFQLGMRTHWIPGQDHREHNIPENQLTIMGWSEHKNMLQWVMSGFLRGP